MLIVEITLGLISCSIAAKDRLNSSSSIYSWFLVSAVTLLFFVSGKFLFCFSNLSFIKSKYYELCHKEYLNIKKFINFGTKNILSIGGGVGGVECLILNNNNCNIDMIEIHLGQLIAH